MKRNYIISCIISLLLFWAICYIFNSTALIGKIVFAKAFISPWLTFTTVMKYFHIGMGVAPWLAYTLAALLLLFLLGSLYFFAYSLLRAIAIKRNIDREQTLLIGYKEGDHNFLRRPLLHYSIYQLIVSSLYHLVGVSHISNTNLPPLAISLCII